MRIVPRTRSGRGLALAAVVLMLADLVSSFWGVSTERGALVASGDVDLGVCGGALWVMRYNGSSKASHHGFHMRPKDLRWTRVVVNASPPIGPWNLTILPLWYAWVPLLGGLVVLERRHAKRSRNPHACKACSYDLAGLPPEAICPECGRARA